MKREPLFSLRNTLLLLALTAPLAACGGDDGEGDGTTCGAGTVYSDVLKACVPDGSNLCSGNTRFDTEMQKCVVDPTLCAEGTVLVGDECLPFDDTLTGDVDEGAEPNDSFYEGTPAAITFPAVDDTVTFKGCITGEDFDDDGVADADIDQFAFQVSGPTVIEVTVDGVGGLVGAFLVEPADTQLQDDSWQRFGFNVSADIARRQIFLPKAGGYFLGVSDFRALTNGVANGNEKTCYFGSLKALSLPAAGAFTLGSPTAASFAAPEFYAGTAEEGDVFDLIVAADPDTAATEPVSPAFVALKDGAYYSSGAADVGELAQSSLYGLRDGQAVTVVVDYVYSLSAKETVDAVLLVSEFAVEELGEDDAFDVVHDAESPWLGRFFEGTAGDVAFLGFDSEEDVIAVVLDPDGLPVATLCDEGCDGASAWYQLPKDGNYYFLFRAADEELDDNTTYGLEVSRASVTPTDVTFGMNYNVSLADNDRAFFALDVSGTDWLSFEASALQNLPAVRVQFFPLGATGALGSELPAAFTYSATADSFPGRVTQGENDVWLVSVGDGATWEGDETFGFKVAERAFTDLGTLSEASPLAAASHATPSGDSKYFLASATPGSKFTITLDPDTALDVALAVYNADGSVLDEADEGGDNTNEVTTVVVGPSGLVGIEVYGGGEAGNFTIAIAVRDPAYDPATVGNVAYADACAGGTVVIDGSNVDMSDPIALDSFAFDFFREEVATMRVSTDGWLTFDSSYAGPGYEDAPASFPNTEAAYHGVISPLFTYVADATVCVKKTATEVTVQWTGLDGLGAFFGQSIPAELQVVLRASGNIDFIYGANNQTAPTVIGLESLSGEEFVNYGGTPVASSSLTFTANP